MMTGKGPFPAIIYNHGSEKTPGWFPTLGQFWTSNGFIFFVPHRHGHGRSPGEYIVDLQEKFRESEKDTNKVQRHTIGLHERYNADVAAAVNWLKTQPDVDTRRLVVSGISYGGIQTVLAAEKDLGVKAFVAFSPAAMSWQGNPLLRVRLLEAVKHAKAPLFLLQARNDYDLGPMDLLGAELKHKGKPDRAQLYPAFGDANNPKDGHGGFAVRGSEVWGKDVLEFLHQVMKH
jgi:dienelactone hydrolase